MRGRPGDANGDVQPGTHDLSRLAYLDCPRGPPMSTAFRLAATMPFSASASRSRRWKSRTYSAASGNEDLAFAYISSYGLFSALDQPDARGLYLLHINIDEFRRLGDWLPVGKDPGSHAHHDRSASPADNRSHDAPAEGWSHHQYFITISSNSRYVRHQSGAQSHSRPRGNHPAPVGCRNDNRVKTVNPVQGLDTAGNCGRIIIRQRSIPGPEHMIEKVACLSVSASRGKGVGTKALFSVHQPTDLE